MEIERPVVVVKYGGSAFREPGDFHRVAIYHHGLSNSGMSPVLVNSARKGASDRLFDVWQGVTRLDEYADEEREFYGGDSGVFRKRKDRDSFMGDMESGFEKMKEVLEAGPSRYPDSHRESFLASHGETEAGLALQYLLRDFTPEIRFLDGHQAGVVATKMRGSVEIEESIKNISQNKGAFCYGGFVGRDPSNPDLYCLLDRNSTDETAALVSSASGAEECWIIKDVEGVYVCDPGILKAEKKPKAIGRLSYSEAADITRGGSPVMHPTGIIICDRYGVKIRITSLDNESEGTIISAASGTTPEMPFAAISSGIYACLTIEDKKMDIPGEGRGYVADVTKILDKAGYDILNLTGPGTAMSVVVASGIEKTKDKGVDLGNLQAVLTRGLRNNGREGVVRGRERGYISITGAAMRGKLGVIRRILEVVEKIGISTSMLGQGDEYFVDTSVVSFCVDPGDYRAAVNALYDELF